MSSSSLAAAATTARRYSSSRNENLPPRTLARVGREIRELYKNPPDGVRLVVDSSSDSGTCGFPTTNLGEVLAEIEGPTGTPYETKYFQLKLLLSSEFPSSPPRGYFMTKIYHPNVDMSTGAICVNTLKKDWTPDTTFAHVLSVIRCLLIVPFPESSLNDEAGKFFMESYDEYAKRAKLMAGVHGRPHSCCAAEQHNDQGNDDDGAKSEENADAKKKSHYHHSRSSSTTAGSSGEQQQPRSKSLRDMNRGNNNSSSSSSKAIKVGNGLKSKKKSLKRL